MSGEFDERHIDGFLARYRPLPPSPPIDECERTLLAARAEKVMGRTGARGHRRLAFAMAAGFLVALGVTFTMVGDRPSPANGVTDEQMEAFLDDTMGHVLTDQPITDTNVLMESLESVAGEEP
jgi:hypothetical protein